MLLGWLKFTDKTVLSSTDKTVLFLPCYISICKYGEFIFDGHKKTGLRRFVLSGEGLAFPAVDSVLDHDTDDFYWLGIAVYNWIVIV